MRGKDTTRRAFLTAVGGSLASAGAIGTATATGNAQYSLRQAGNCYPITPLSGDVPVQKFYDYQLPSRYRGVGASDGGGPYFSSKGTQSLQRPDTSLLFLYDGPNGLGLVVVHGSVSHSSHGGGSATFTFAGMPAGGKWVVADDSYIDRHTGNRAPTNYDRWHTGGSTQKVSWTWNPDGTDGGVFRGLGSSFAVTIDPAFNGAAERLVYNYDGSVTDWQLLSGSVSSPHRQSLDMSTPVTITAGGCGDGTKSNVGRQTTQPNHQKADQKQAPEAGKEDEKSEKKDEHGESGDAEHGKDAQDHGNGKDAEHGKDAEVHGKNNEGKRGQKKGRKKRKQARERAKKKQEKAREKAKKKQEKAREKAKKKREKAREKGKKKREKAREKGKKKREKGKKKREKAKEKARKKRETAREKAKKKKKKDEKGHGHDD